MIYWRSNFASRFLYVCCVPCSKPRKG